MAYRIAVDGMPIDAITSAARSYLQHKVKRADNRFAPSAAEFAEQCRYQEWLAIAARTPKVEHTEDVDDSPRVDAEKLKTLHRHLSGDSRATEELRQMFPHNKIINGEE